MPDDEFVPVAELTKAKKLKITKKVESVDDEFIPMDEYAQKIVKAGELREAKAIAEKLREDVLKPQ